MDKKLFKLSFAYAVIGMLTGAVYREFSKFADFDGKTIFSVIHTHMIILGAIMFLILFLFERLYSVSEEKMFRAFFYVYNIALVINFATMYARGTIQILQVEIANGLSAAISGMAGMSHGLLGISLILLFIAFKRTLFVKNEV